MPLARYGLGVRCHWMFEPTTAQKVRGINELVRDLRAKNICTKARTFSAGKTRGGIPFGRGALSYFLRNRFFMRKIFGPLPTEASRSLAIHLF
jgi:hypothetical protein